MDIGEAMERLTPALDAFASAIVAAGGSATVAAEVGGHLIVRRTGRTRFDVTLREPDDEVDPDADRQIGIEGGGL